MTFPYKKVVVLGATSGLGWALAAKFVETGTSVIAVGRRTEKLNEFSQKYGNSGKATVDTVTFDITDLKGIPGFAADLFKKHSDIDCIMLNSGIQKHLDWSKPEQVSLETVELEILTNYTSYLHLTKAVLPFLQKQAPRETALVFTTSGLALVPVIYCPGYCATKAALHHQILVMREQMKAAKSNVKIIELYPPAVQTELHDAKHQPEFGDRGKSLGMPIEEFVAEAFEGLCKPGDENEQVPIQAVKSFMGFSTWEQERQNKMKQMMERMAAR